MDEDSCDSSDSFYCEENALEQDEEVKSVCNQNISEIRWTVSA